MSHYDEFFLSDGKGSVVASMFRFPEGIEFLEMKEFLKKNLPIRCERANCRLVNVLGNLYWKMMTMKELDTAWDKCCVKIDNVKSQEDLQKFIGESLNE